MLQPRVEDQYFVHDLLLDFAKINIKAKKLEVIKKAATSRQTQYLGRLDVLLGYFVHGNSLNGMHSLMGLWQSLIELSGNEQLVVGAYTASLGALEEEDKLAATICSALGQLYNLQVG